MGTFVGGKAARIIGGAGSVRRPASYVSRDRASSYIGALAKGRISL